MQDKAIASAARVCEDMVEHQNELDNRTQTVVKLDQMIAQLTEWRDEIVESMMPTE